MIKDFFKHSFIYSIGIILTRGISFLLLPLYTRALTTNDYGLISLLSSAAALALPFLTLELTAAIGIFYTESKEQIERQQYISTAFWFILATNLCYLFLFCYNYHLLDPWYFKDVANKTILPIVFTATVVNAIFNYLQSQLLWQQKSLQYSMITLTSVTVTIVLTIYFVLKMALGAIGVFMASLLGNMVGGVFAYLYTKGNLRFTFSFDKLKKLLSFSLPLIPSNLGFYAFLYIDQLVVNHYLGLTPAGIYSVACRFVIIVNLILYAVGNALPPFIYQRHQDQRTKVSLEFITRLFVILAFLIVLGLSLAGRDVILLFTTPAYIQGAKLISILAMATFLININIFVPGLIIKKKTLQISYLNVVAAILNLLLCWWLVPHFGVIGAAMGSLLSAALYAMCYFSIGQKNYRIDYAVSKYIFGFCAFSTLYLIFSYYDLVFSSSIWFDLFIKGLMAIPITLLLLIVSLKRDEWRRLFAFYNAKSINRVLS